MQLVTLTVPPSVAARIAGLTPQCVSMKKSREPDFLNDIERAEAKAQAALLAVIVTAAKTDPDQAWRLLERRWPELYARAEIRADLENTNVNVEELKRAIMDGLELLAKRHAPPNAPDVDAPSAIATPSPPTSDGNQVTRA